MTLEETMEFVQSVSWLGCRPGLERITDLMHRLGDPQKELRYIHITGTNGKGSTAAMLSSILTAAGYTVGLFTSPHLVRYNERIKINGQDISDEDLCAAAAAVKPAVDQMDAVPSEFERFTAMAFWYFRQKKCGIVVLEVGMGGQMDSTNVIPAPEAAVLTSIGLDHTEYLGDTLEEIAATKAGIIKPGADVVLYGQSQAVEDMIRSRCADCGASLTVTDAAQLEVISEGLEGQRLDYRDRKDLELPLLGTYQSRNAAVVLDTVDTLCRRGWDIPETAVRRGLSSVAWPGRFEVLHREPLVLLDGAHNPNGVEELEKCLRTYLPGRKLIFMMGVMADKSYDEMLDRMAPLAKGFITVTPDNTRALAAGQLREDIETRLGLPARAAGSVPEGIALSLGDCTADDAVCIFGSLYMAGEVRECFPAVLRQWQGRD